VPGADAVAAIRDVCFYPESENASTRSPCLLRAMNRIADNTTGPDMSV
jgi:hypothetical protein